MISIHAPSRERLVDKSAGCKIFVFQSTLPHGSDLDMLNEKLALLKFQSTLPHGSDHHAECSESIQ